MVTDNRGHYQILIWTFVTKPQASFTSFIVTKSPYPHKCHEEFYIFLIKQSKGWHEILTVFRVLKTHTRKQT